MNDFIDLPTLIFIGITIVVLLRLRSVLGTRTGNERPASKRISEQDDTKAAKNDKKVVPLHPNKQQNEPQQSKLSVDEENHLRKLEAQIEKFAPNDAKLAQGLDDIAKNDNNFMPKSFLEGAKSAYEMIVTAFANGDKKTLKNLLEKDVYEGFVSVINDREKQGYKVDFTFVGLPKIEFANAQMIKNEASVSIRFFAEVVSATRDSEGNLIEGNGDQVSNIADSWTFARNTRSNDPNWKLVATDQLD